MFLQSSVLLEFLLDEINGNNRSVFGHIVRFVLRFGRDLGELESKYSVGILPPVQNDNNDYETRKDPSVAHEQRQSETRFVFALSNSLPSHLDVVSSRW